MHRAASSSRLFNLYNLIAGAALAPAFIAACLEAAGARPRRTAMAEVGGLWCLLVLGGDPFFAAVSLLLALSALLARGGKAYRPPNGRSPSWLSRASWIRLAAALALGTLIAAPMLVEFLHILPLSYRGYWRYSVEAALAQSWDPRSILEWLLPFFFGRPDFTFWGARFYGGNPPLLFSVYPGILALALVAAGGRPRGRATWWGWGVTAGGLFFALGAWNPVVRLLYQLPGASVLRYPVKFWLAVAIGAALLCGLGLEEVLGGRRRSRLALILGALALLFVVGWMLLRLGPDPLLAALGQLEPRRLQGGLLDVERERWSDLSLLTL